MSAPLPLQLGEDPISLSVFIDVVRRRRPVVLSGAAKARMEASRRPVDQIAAGGDGSPRVYGVNTGFGALAEVAIDQTAIRELQRNLVRSHAAGVGEPLPEPVVRGMLLLRAAVLACGHSGVRPVVAERLCQMLDRGVNPAIPWQGSVGASGDLAPLAHLALVVMGEGHATFEGRRMTGAEAMKAAGLEPIAFQAKEGLSLVNGTQLMAAAGGLYVADAQALARTADVAGVMSLEAMMGSRRPFDARITAARPHPGAVTTAANLWRLTAGSGINAAHGNCERVQDAYSFRCMPQVHGACRDGLTFARGVLETEFAAATDNPLVFTNGDAPADFISGGNFHGEPLALALDFAAIAVAELGSVAERRIEQMLNPALSGLPPFLGARRGLDSGFMMAQVTAAALCSENKVLCHPASVDSIPTSAGREDHVSMGAHAAWKLGRVVANVRHVLAIEVMCAAQGLDLRAPLRPGPGVRAAHEAVRRLVPTLTADREIAPDINAVAGLIETGALVAAAEEAVGSLS